MAVLLLRVLLLVFLGAASSSRVAVGAGGQVEGDVAAAVGVAAESDAPGLALLDRELVELEQTIALQQRKLALLAAVRRQYLNGSRALPAGLLPALDDADQLREFGDRFASDRAPRSRETPAARRRSDEQEVAPRQFGDYLLARVKLSFESPITASEVLSFRMRGAPTRSKKNRGKTSAAYVNLLAVADAQGVVRIYDSNSELVVEFDSGHADVLAIAFDGQDEPLMATSARDGSLHVHNLTLWRDATVIAGRRPRMPPAPAPVIDENGEEQPVPRPKPTPPARKTSAGLGMIVKKESAADVPKPDAPAHIYSTGAAANLSVDAQIQVMQIHNWRGQGKFVLAGDSAGALRLYARNGTLHRVLHQENGVLALRRSGASTFAVPDGTDVAFLSASRFEFTSTRCKGVLSPVVSLAYDVLVPSMLYAGLASGEIVVFNTKAKTENRIVCRLSNKLPNSPHTSAVALATVRGYALSASSTAVAVHNSTSMHGAGPRFVASITTSEAISLPENTSLPPQAPVFLSASYSTGMLQSSEVIVAVAHGPHVSVYESLLPYFVADNGKQARARARPSERRGCLTAACVFAVAQTSRGCACPFSSSVSSSCLAGNSCAAARPAAVAPILAAAASLTCRNWTRCERWAAAWVWAVWIWAEAVWAAAAWVWVVWAAAWAAAAAWARGGECLADRLGWEAGGSELQF